MTKRCCDSFVSPNEIRGEEKEMFMKKNQIFLSVIVCLLVLTSCINRKNEDIEKNVKTVLEAHEADAGWQNAYKSFLEKLYKKNKYSNTIYKFSVRDMDANGIPELIILKNALKMTIYSYQDEMITVGKEDFKSGTTRFLISKDASYPGIFIYSVGGGYEWYRYLTMDDNKLIEEKLWNNDFSGISKILKKKRKKVQKTSANRQLIRESRTVYLENSRLISKTVHPDNYKYVEDFEEVVDFLHISIGMDKSQVEQMLKGRKPKKWNDSGNHSKLQAIYALKSGGEVWIEYSGNDLGNSLCKVAKMEYHGDKTIVNNDYVSRIQRFSNLNLNQENIAEFSDSKGVFFEEGEVLLKFQYSNKEYKAVKGKILSKEHWKKLPIKSLSEEDLLCDSLLLLNFEKPKKGLFLFYDRHKEASSPYDYNEMIKRDRMNFSAIFFDDDTKQIIYMEMDY